MNGRIRLAVGNETFLVSRVASAPGLHEYQVRGLTPNGTYFKVAERREPSGEMQKHSTKPDCFRRSATSENVKVSSIRLTPPGAPRPTMGKYRTLGLAVFSSLLVIAAVLLTNRLVHANDLPLAVERPNIVILFADDLGYGDVGCYGAKGFVTPQLDRMASEGTRFTSFYVAQPVCTASRAALMTGCYSNRVGMAGALNHTSPIGIAADEVLLPELCQQAGYVTACFGKWHLGHHPQFLPTRNGFHEFFGIPYSNDNGPLHPVIRDIPGLPLIEGEQPIETDPDQSQFTRRITDHAVQFIERNAARPFFLYVPHIMPHVPIFASDKYRGRTTRGLYGDVVEELDDSVGEVLSTLKRLNIDDRTLVIFASDNGPFLSYGEHAGSAGPLREGKLTTFEGGVRVPCLMRWPGRIPAGRVCDELASTLDLYPTLAGLIGAKLPERRIDGQNLAPLLLGQPDAKPREVFHYYSGDELHAVRWQHWKLHLPHEYLTTAAEPGRGGKPSNYGKLAPAAIEQSGIRGIASRHGYRVESIGLSLFNLQDDVSETHNIANAHPDIVARLQALAAEARADLGDSLTKATGKNLRPAGRATGTASR